jgi:hypothetical protein
VAPKQPPAADTVAPAFTLAQHAALAVVRKMLHPLGWEAVVQLGVEHAEEAVYFAREYDVVQWEVFRTPAGDELVLVEHADRDAGRRHTETIIPTLHDAFAAIAGRVRAIAATIALDAAGLVTALGAAGA